MSEPTDSIQELFDRDPLSLTRPDIEKIIEYYRERRATFLQSGARAMSAKPKKDSGKAAGLNLDLGDLKL